MMTEIEDRLRDDLKLATDGVGDDLDVDALLTIGRRRRTARTQRRTLGAVAVATVVGLVAWVGLTAQPPTIGVPDPMSTPSTVAPATSITVQLTGMDEAPPYSELTLSLKGDQIAIKGRKRNTSTLVPVATVPLDTTAARGRRIDPEIYLWTVPGQVSWVHGVDSLRSSTSPGQVYFSAAGVTVHLVSSAAVTKPEAIEGLIWLSADGTLHSSSGEEVETARLRFADRTLVVFRDRKLSTLSWYDPVDGLGWGSIRTTEFPDTDVVPIRASSERDDGNEVINLGLLPHGARDPKVTTSDPNTQVVVGTLEPSGDVVFMAVLETKSEPPDRLVTKVVYTAADGGTRTYKG